MKLALAAAVDIAKAEAVLVMVDLELLSSVIQSLPLHRVWRYQLSLEQLALAKD
jgi:hypothetical protein